MGFDQFNIFTLLLLHHDPLPMRIHRTKHIIRRSVLLLLSHGLQFHTRCSSLQMTFEFTTIAWNTLPNVPRFFLSRYYRPTITWFQRTAIILDIIVEDWSTEHNPNHIRTNFQKQKMTEIDRALYATGRHEMKFFFQSWAKFIGKCLDERRLARQAMHSRTTLMRR